METTTELSDLERGVLRHALGLDRSAKPYRNHYVAEPGHHSYFALRSLEDRDLMTRRLPFTWHVTESGAAAIGATLPKE